MIIIIIALGIGIFISKTDFSPSDPLIEEAEKHIGIAHREGGAFPEQGFDSSGFVQYVFNEVLGFMLPRTLDQQMEQGKEVNREDIEEGDVLFFSKDGGSVSHSAIYMGDDRLIHPTVSKGVEVTHFNDNSYWSGNFIEARRISEPPDIAEDNDIVAVAQQYLDVPYEFGGETPNGFDCSGFVQYVFDEVSDIYLPRTTDQQWQAGEEVNIEDIQPGDVLFYSDTYREGISHNGIYIGGGQFIHASRTQEVTTSYVSEEYWQEKFTGVKRFNQLKVSSDDPVVSEAARYIGEVPYQSGGTTRAGFDTAGFIQYVFREAEGIQLPRTADEQWEKGAHIDKEDLQPGDLVFLEATHLNPAIYVGNHQVVHVTPDDGVTVTNIEASNYWGPKFFGAKRVEK
ncbi:C40 family peptidase [Halobacillus andaensis]|uniref:C40 family peptidase n=1 Tax=Halobacillus andaensis TaxID=1176239 RepID=UPI001E46162F|nr:NlpC/P60 family protein [Halobacillus andaensis]MBP2002923.1 cell wall-associated NlpC family hydrolase [Halobacillus andaensis]